MLTSTPPPREPRPPTNALVGGPRLSGRGGMGERGLAKRRAEGAPPVRVGGSTHRRDRCQMSPVMGHGSGLGGQGTGGFLSWLWVVCGVLSAAATVMPVCAEELRDPFMFGPGAGGVMRQGELMLMGVLWDAARPLAIVGDEPVEVGTLVAGWQIVEIQQSGIVVQRGDRQEFVAIGNSLPSD